MWRDLGRPTMDAALRRKVVEEMIGDADLEAVRRRRDELLLSLVRRKAGVGLLP